MHFSIRSSLASLAVLAVLLSAVVAASAPAAAQSAEDAVNATAAAAEATPEEPEVFETIDQDTRLLSAEFEDGQHTLVLESDVRQVVTISDVGSFPGKIPSRSIAVQPGETVTVRLPGQSDGGRAGVTIATDRTIYGVIVQSGGAIITGPWSGGDVRTASLSAFGVTALLTGARVWSRKRNRRTDPERVA